MSVDEFRTKAALLRRLAKTARDPVIVQALLDLAAEFAREAASRGPADGPRQAPSLRQGKPRHDPSCDE